MSRRKPKFLGEEYEIKLVSTPPPGPPEYELVNAWPHAPRNTRHAQRNKAPIIISLIALIIAILSMYSSILNPYFLQGSLGVTTVKTVTTTTIHIFKTTITTTETTATTIPETTIITIRTTISFSTTDTMVKSIRTGNISLLILPANNFECSEFRQKVRLANFTLSKYNGTHRLLSLEIDILSTNNRVTENNFSVNLIKDFKLELNKLGEPDTYQVSVYHRLEESDITVYFKSNETRLCPIIRIVFKD